MAISLLELISAGTLMPQARVPARTALAAGRKVSPGAASRAVGWLTGERILVRGPGVSCYVHPDAALKVPAAMQALRDGGAR